MNTRILSTTFIGEALEISLLEDILDAYPDENESELLKKVIAIISLSTLSLAFESIEDMHQKAAFLSAVPQLLSLELTLSNVSRFRPELPQILTEHITRSLLSLRTKLIT
ncbi:MAG: hypothetical protein GW762_05515 [Candidatus Pacebacteria bacterium]|nr:hypothetical protein [Candidatus Paceibacterota bacterium]PIR63892.1 MAG: hypothetical protein COU64_02885 [Candidatus Pacebacteria bacterium CG10_big_fil_rev_8_21_14_0_10_40_26]PIZ78331.1 MAG: hypothetical protein COY01_06145 [Candidatus Pacebacteria bacterium CG_4_10_14_0_2_um_filter_40_20]PJA68625.1 MAG: hypothetical protein CO156_03900 [Candidatus Pacebacteria bacterium CG_4_9_14_3_um_filter_40_12]PJC41565.1 MAG: hypothetical protein CO041_02490 [Candidatus Pacebacteria bacterium CG_4_9_